MMSSAVDILTPVTMRCHRCGHVQPARAWCALCGEMLGPEDIIAGYSQGGIAS